MKRLIIILCFIIAITTACDNVNNITFNAVIESVDENSMMITALDDVGFDRASVGYAKNMKIEFEPVVGQIIEVTILPEVRESYPVQVTAVKIELIDEEIEMPSVTEYKKITAEEAKMYIDGGNVIILDVRTQEEYDLGYIRNSILIPDTEIEDKAETMLKDKSARILIYCRSGRRSALAAYALIDMGYTDVYDFGGIIDWTYEIEK